MAVFAGAAFIQIRIDSPPRSALATTKPLSTSNCQIRAWAVVRTARTLRVGWSTIRAMPQVTVCAADASLSQNAVAEVTGFT